MRWRSRKVVGKNMRRRFKNIFELSSKYNL